MDAKYIAPLTVGGIIIFTAVLLGSDLAIFINPTGLLLVVGGTMAGACIAFPWQTIRDLWREIKEMGRRRVMSCEELQHTFVQLARLQRTEGARTLEAAAQKTGNSFLQMGMALVVDDRPREEIRERLEQEFEFFLSRREAQRGVLSLMGRLAPAFGLAGTMIGLIRMLHTIKDPAAVTEGMSVALLTTFYGIMLANLLVLPLERKLNELTRAEAVEMTLITEGLMGLEAEENGAAIFARLSSYHWALPPAPRRPAPATAKLARQFGRALKGLRLRLPSLSRSAGHER